MTDRSTDRPRAFGRSLNPLDGESLAGFVLRLSYRLRIAPAKLVRLTGLTDHDRFDRARSVLSTSLTPAQAERFAALTRLTPGEVSAMTLAPYASHYPPLGRAMENVRQGRFLTIHTSEWLFAMTARYCPACLAGDGSAVQNEYGGPWQTLWRLPVVFSCPRHRVFLEHLCPGCHEPINANYRAHLVARPAVAGIHPAHCRATGAEHRKNRWALPCGARLGQGPRLTHRPGPALLALQNKILSMLGPDYPAESAHQYFTELQLLAALVMTSWPRIRPAGTTSSLAAALDEYLTGRDDTGAVPYHSNKAPLDARACAGVLQITDRILTSDDLRAALVPLAPQENRTRTGIVPTRHVLWDQAFRKQHSACSERFQLAADTLVPTYRRTGKGGPRIPSVGIRYRAEHIPASLPQALADRHLSAFTDVTSKMRRRNASVFLVRRAQGGTLDEAAQFLGISTPGKTIGFATKLTHYLRANDLLHDFELALDAIAADLLANPLVDYQQRRTALHGWTLEPHAWQSMVRAIPVFGNRQPINDDRKRLAVSVYIWTRVTEGEHELAPCPPHIARDPELHTGWSRQRHNICYWLREADKHPYYGALKPLLDAHAEQLARAIDKSTPSSR